MNKIITGLLAAGTVLFGAANGTAAEIFTDNFDSYADVAAFEAAWAPYGTQNGSVVFDTAEPHSAPNSIQHPGDGTSLIRRGRTITAVTPTDAEPLVVDFWLRHNNATQGRYTVSVGGATGTPPLELGESNNVATTQWMARMGGSTATFTPAVGSPAAGTTAFQPVGGSRGTGVWKNLKMVVKQNSADLYEDNVLLGNISRVANIGAVSVVSFGGVVSSGNPVSNAANVSIDDVVVGIATSNVNDWNLY